MKCVVTTESFGMPASAAVPSPLSMSVSQAGSPSPVIITGSPSGSLAVINCSYGVLSAGKEIGHVKLSVGAAFTCTTNDCCTLFVPSVAVKTTVHVPADMAPKGAETTATPPPWFEYVSHHGLPVIENMIWAPYVWATVTVCENGSLSSRCRSTSGALVKNGAGTSTAPMSGRPAREAPVWSCAGARDALAASIAGLPSSGRRLSVGPPLYASGPSLWSSGDASVPTRSPATPFTKAPEEPMPIRL